MLGGVGVALCGLAFMLGGVLPGLIALTAGSAVILLAGTVGAARSFEGWLAARDRGQFDRLLGDAERASLLVTRDGIIDGCNGAATSRLGAQPGSPLSAVLEAVHADPIAFVRGMQEKLSRQVEAPRRVTAPWGERSYTIEQFSEDLMLWHIDLPSHTDPRDSLPVPILQFDPEGRLLYASEHLRAKTASLSFSLDKLFSGRLPEPGLPVPLDDEAIGPGLQAIRFQLDAQSSHCVILLAADSSPETGPASLTSEESRQLQTLPVGLAHLGEDGQILYVNDEARRLLRLRERELPLLSDILEGLGRPVTEWIADISARRLARAHEVLRLSNDSAETYLKLSLSVARTGASASRTVVAVLSDVTEFKSLEAKFTQSQKMQAIGQLAGGVAHDFNNLLTAIAGHCDLLLLRHDRHDPDFPDLMQIQQNSNRAAALVRQLLALSRKQSLKFVTLDLPETMEDVIHLLNRLVGEKITLSIRHGAGVAPIRSDKRQFEQVLMNLVVNARDALPMGGEIRIETRACSFPKGIVRDEVELPPGDYTLIKISDDGIGIPQPLLSKIFDPFFTTKRQGEGTGLGLSTVYGIVKQSGGYIFVDSEEGVGTTFSLYFSAQRASAPAQKPPEKTASRAPGPNAPQALILLVEDEAPVRSFAARALELQGHRVLTAESGEAALDILSDPDIQPDCFVTDVIMPGLDGPGWIKEIRGRFPDTPVLFISGYAEDSHIAAQSRIENAAFLGKPFSLAEFTDAVSARLHKRDEIA